MTTFKRELHSVNGLVTFEVAARLLSFTRAADELHVTQAAVSRQIQRLEEQLGVQLFYRAHQQLELTGAGRQLRDAVTGGLNELALGVRRVRIATNAPLVTVSATIAFATYWLMPRLHGFAEENPGIDIRVIAADRVLQPRIDDVDIAICYGDERYLREAGRTLVAREVVLPVCSPSYLRDRPHLAVAEPAMLKGEKLLHLDAGHWGQLRGVIIDWPVWFDHFGVRLTEGLHGIRTNNYPMLVEALIVGRGIALGWRPIIDDLLAEGRLVPLGTQTIEGQMGYHVAVAPETALSDAARQVHDWLMAEIRALRPEA